MNDAASEPGDGTAAAGDGGAPRVAFGKGRALVPVPRPAAKAGFVAGLGLGRSHGAVAASVAVLMGVGFVAGTAAFASKPQVAATAQQAAAQAAPQAVPPADAALDVLMRVQGEVRSLRAGLDALRAAADDGRQADANRGLRRSVEALRQDLDGVKAASTASAGAVAQLGAKIDRIDRDPGPKLNEIAARLDKLDREADARAAEARGADGRTADAKAADAKAADARIAQVASQLTARLDRIERQVAAADATGSVPAQAAAGAPAAAARPPLLPQRAPQLSAAPTPSSPAGVTAPARAEVVKADPARNEPAKPHDAPVRPATVEGWLLRDVYGGVALVEGRAGGLREVAPGEYVPGVGEIRSIERRGRGWVVVTSRGLIQADNRW